MKILKNFRLQIFWYKKKKHLHTKDLETEEYYKMIREKKKIKIKIINIIVKN